MILAMMTPPWNEPETGLLDSLTHYAMFAADDAAIKSIQATPHQQMKAAVRAGLRCLIVNGFITPVPEEDWPEWVHIDLP